MLKDEVVKNISIYTNETQRPYEKKALKIT